MEDEYGVESMETMGMDDEVVEEETEVDVLEFGLDEESIDVLIASLHDLKGHKKHISFPIDEGNELAIHYEKEAGDELSVDGGELGGGAGDLGGVQPDLGVDGEPEVSHGNQGDELHRGGFS
jgi:hypothetical protein